LPLRVAEKALGREAALILPRALRSGRLDARERLARVIPNLAEALSWPEVSRERPVVLKQATRR
jgi:hypothetical protein